MPQGTIGSWGDTRKHCILDCSQPKFCMLVESTREMGEKIERQWRILHRMFGLASLAAQLGT